MTGNFKIKIELSVKDGRVLVSDFDVKEDVEEQGKRVASPDSLNGFLWKPASDVDGRRGGKPVVLLSSPHLKLVEPAEGILVADSEGEILGAFGYKESDEPGINNNSQHFFAGWGDGINLGARQLWRLADRRGIFVVLEEQGLWIGPFDPRERHGSV